MSEGALQRTARTTLGRYPERAAYDRATIHEILDDGYLCVVAYALAGSPRALPTGYGRIGDHVYLHGAHANAMIAAALGGCELCVLVTHVDGLALGRSLFNHSLNYRSLVIYGRAERVADPEEKRASFQAFADQLLAGRAADVRPPSESELASATVIRIPIVEAVAKTRRGPVADFEADLARDCWAGEMLVMQSACALIRDPRGWQDAQVPEYLTNYRRLPRRDGWSLSEPARAMTVAKA